MRTLATIVAIIVIVILGAWAIGWIDYGADETVTEIEAETPAVEEEVEVETEEIEPEVIEPETEEAPAE